MKKKVLIYLMCAVMGISFAACSDGVPKEDNITEADAEDAIQEADEADTAAQPDDTDNTSSETDKEDIAASIGHEIVSLNDDSTVYMIDADDSVHFITKCEGNEGYIISTEAIGDFVYIVKNDYEIGGMKVEVYDKDGNLVATPLMETQKSHVNVVGYKGQVYIDCTDYANSEEKSKAEIYVYDPATKLCSHDNEMQDLERSIQDAGYSFLMYQNSLMMTLRQFDGEIYVKYGENDENICQLDPASGEKKKNVVKIPANGYIEQVSGDYICVRTSDYDNNKFTVTVYDMKNGGYIELYNGSSFQDIPNLIGGAGGKFYGYQESDGTPKVVSLIQYDGATGEEKTIVEGSTQAGTAGYYYSLFLTGFKATDANIYYLDVADNNLVWKRLDPESGEVVNTKASVYEYTWTKYADIDIHENRREYPDNNQTYYEYHIETVKIKDDIKNADKINAALAERDKELLDICESKISEEIPEEYMEGEYRYNESNERSLAEIREIGSHYITIDFSGYDYWGGAHGMPYLEHYLFDLNSGEEVTLADLCDMDDEVFKNLIAMKTVENWKNDDAVYYESYEYNPDYGKDLFADVKEFASKDMPVSYYGDYINIEYAPYQYGPYASGFIFIPVSYEELGIDINK